MNASTLALIAAAVDDWRQNTFSPRDFRAASRARDKRADLTYRRRIRRNVKR